LSLLLAVRYDVVTMRFEDHFSRLARTYARHRPHHPPPLFAYLARLAPARDLAWDCGTGNGQAAVELARRFARVYASDASAEQIAHATAHERIEYRVEPAEGVSLATGSADLVTVAIAVHWFDFDPFYSQVRRVLKPDGVLAVWTYHLPTIEPAVDRLLHFYYSEVLGTYWPDRFRYVDDHYRTLPFPFAEIEPPPFSATAEWNLDQLAGFLGSWSATRPYSEREGRHPLEAVWQDLQEAWGDAVTRRLVRWPLHLRVGRPDGAEAHTTG
jgi:SAM-dependent methyltransferase